jgi:hypothetical protein
MDVTLAHPWGLLGLLGVPALLAIHLLQRRAVVIPVSTLFLLESLNRESEGGRRVERLRASLPLWLQLLAVLLLTWLLTDPRWLDKTSVQRIAIVLDSSASMTVAKPGLLESLPEDLSKLAKATAQSEFHLLDTRMEAGPLYHGPAGRGIQEALDSWQPAGGSQDPLPALRLARSLAGREGLVLYVTDAETPSLPPGVRLYASGRPIDNAGIAGVTVEDNKGQAEWRVTLRNYSTTPQTRELLVVSGQTTVNRGSITLPAQGLTQRQGPFPPGMEELTLSLTPDAFPMDDSAPVLKPQPKEVTVNLPPDSEPGGDLYASLFNSLPAVKVITGPPAMPVIAYNPLNPALPDGPAVIFVRDPKPSATVLPGALLIEAHPLTDGLGWQGLICQDSIRIPLRPEDEPLIWIGERAVVFLRTSGQARQLCFNFDLRKSNARRLPALVLTLHRWMEDFRRQLPAGETTLSECGQLLAVAPRPAPAPDLLSLRPQPGPATTRPAREAPLLRAPALPGLLEVWQGNERLLRTASHFADIREADFTSKLTRHDLAGATSTVTLQHSQEDPAWRAWLLAMLATAGLSWWWLARPRQKTRQPAAA